MQGTSVAAPATRAADPGDRADVAERAAPTVGDAIPGVTSSLRWAALVYIFCTPLDVVPLPVGTPVTLAGAVFLTLWVFEWASGRVRVPTAPLIYAALFAFVLWSAVSTLWSAVPSTTMIQTFTTLFLTISAVAVGCVFRGSLVAPAAALALGSTLAGVAAMISGPEVALLNGVSVTNGQATFLGIDQNALAFHLCLGFAAAVYLATRRQGRLLLLSGLAMTALIAAAVIVVGSRTGVAALIATVIVSIVLAMRSTRQVVAAFVALVVVAVVARLLADAGLVPARIVDWIANPFATDSRDRIIEAYRMYESVWLGKGVGAGASADYLLATLSWYKEAHSSFWKIWIELGIIGLAMWLTALTALAVRAWRAGERSFFLLSAPAIAFFFYTLGPINSNDLWVVYGLALGAVPALGARLAAPSATSSAAVLRARKARAGVAA